MALNENPKGGPVLRNWYQCICQSVNVTLAISILSILISFLTACLRYLFVNTSSIPILFLFVAW